MKVLFVIDSLEVGGAEKSMLSMAPYFNNTELSVCHLYKGDQLKREYEAAGINVYSLQLTGSYSFFRAYKKLKDVVAIEKPDIIHATLLRSSLVCRVLCRFSKIPLVGSLVSDSYSRERYKSINFSRKLKLFFFQCLDRFTAHWCTIFIAISKTSAESNAKHLKISKNVIQIIYRGREANAFVHNKSDRIEPESFQFISVGRLVKSKGHENLIYAFCEQGLKQRPVKLLIAGKGPEQKKLQDLIVENHLQEKVFLLGERSDISELLYSSNAFLFPSHYEGLGGAMIEGMMAALPVICSDIPVFREYVRTYETGLLAPVGVPNEWARQMVWMIENPKEAISMGRRGQEMARVQFDIRTIADKYEQLYTALYENTPARNPKTIQRG